MISILEPILITIIPPTLLIYDLISFSLGGSGYFLTSYYLTSLIMKKRVSVLIYILIFIAVFSIFEQNQILIGLQLPFLSIIALRLGRLLTETSLACYLISTFNIVSSALLKSAFLGLKFDPSYTIMILFANMIVVYISLKLLTRSKLGNRA